MGRKHFKQHLDGFILEQHLDGFKVGFVAKDFVHVEQEVFVEGDIFEDQVGIALTQTFNFENFLVYSQFRVHKLDEDRSMGIEQFSRNLEA